MADPVVSYRVFKWQNPATGAVDEYEIDIDSMSPGHPKFGETMKGIQELRQIYKTEPEVIEPDVKLTWEKPVVKAVEGIRNVFMPKFMEPKTVLEENEDIMPAGKYKELTSLGGQTSGGVMLPVIAGLLAPKTGGLTLVGLGALGAATGEFGAGQMQGEAGLMTDPGGPLKAAAIDTAFGMLGSTFTGVNRALFRKGLSGESSEQARATVQALRRAGMKKPSAAQAGKLTDELVSEVGGLGPQLQQLSMDLPWHGHAQRWMAKELRRVDAAFKKVVTRTSRQQAGKTGQDAMDMGVDAWKRIGGSKFDEAWDFFPQGQKTAIDGKPFFDALEKYGVDNDFVMEMAKGGSTSARRFKKFVDTYGTKTGVLDAQGNELVKFRDIPIEEFEKIRKSIGDLYHASEVQNMPKGLDKEARDALYGGVRESYRRAADRINPNINTALDDAFDYWARNADADIKFIKGYSKLVNDSDFFNKFDRAIKAGKAAADPEDLNEINAVMKRIGQGEMGIRGRRELQEGILSRYAYTPRGFFDPFKFAQWWEGVDDVVKDAVFEPTLKNALEDFVTVGRVMWPDSRKIGALFAQQQLERPMTVAKQGGLLSPGGMGAVIGGGAVGSATVHPFIGAMAAMFWAAPAIGSRLMTNQAMLRWVTNGAKLGPEALGDHFGKLTAIIANSKDPEARELGMQVYDFLDEYTTQHQQPQMPGPGVGLIK
jgi:hypothetical protein